MTVGRAQTSRIRGRGGASQAIENTSLRAEETGPTPPEACTLLVVKVDKDRVRILSGRIVACVETKFPLPDLLLADKVLAVVIAVEIDIALGTISR